MPAYKYPRAALTVDCVVFGCELEGPDPQLSILLIKRKNEPFRGDWAFPGGFLQVDEAIEDGARRELLEETGIDCPYMEQLFTFGGLERDPRERVISIAYFALVNQTDFKVKAATDASDAKWWPVDSLPELAFDHDQILQTAIERLQGKIRYQPIGFELLPEKFSLSQIQKLYEIILQRDLDKRNFRKKIMALDILVDCKQKQTNVSHRAANLYRFDKKKYERKAKKGFSFEL